MMNINSLNINIINMLHDAYTTVLMYISSFLQELGLSAHDATELSPIVLLFLTIFVTYLMSYTFTAFKKYVQGFIILFAIIILVAVLVK
jgi:glucan phosphoethanolaminetransferase (alkaline phosphatase superfamily)